MFMNMGEIEKFVYVCNIMEGFRETKTKTGGNGEEGNKREMGGVSSVKEEYRK